MTRELCKEKIEYLLMSNRKYIQDLIDKAMNCGAIDIEGYESNFLLPKIIMTAVYTEMARQYEPFTKAGKKEVKNLKVFL